MNSTEFIVTLPESMQIKIRNRLAQIEDADIEIAMCGRLSDLEENFNWRAVLKPAAIKGGTR